MNRKRAGATAAAAIAAVLALAGCGGHHHGHATAKASAVATSTVAQAGKKDAEALLARCLPPGAAGQVRLLTSKLARQQVMQCAGVPKGERQAAAECVLADIEKGGKLPGGRQAKELALLNDAMPCLRKYQGNVK